MEPRAYGTIKSFNGHCGAIVSKDLVEEDRSYAPRLVFWVNHTSQANFSFMCFTTASTTPGSVSRTSHFQPQLQFGLRLCCAFNELCDLWCPNKEALLDVNRTLSLN